MAKLRSLGELQDHLDADLAWRIKEVGILRGSLSGESSLSKSTLIRANLTLLYAHWEGFVKSSSSGYLEYVSRRGLRYCDLIDCFIFIGLKRHLIGLVETKGAASGQEALIFVREMLETVGTLSFAGAIKTDSNLSSSVFDNIAKSVGIATLRYESYYKLIDESLVKRRNQIAHGEYLDIEEPDVRALADNVLKLMRWFKTDIENAASLELFRRVVI